MESYTELDERAALVQIWSQLDYTPNFIFVLVKWLVSLGAIAGLAASMFGSMFPMPRIGKNRHALKKYDQFVLNASCFWGSIGSNITLVACNFTEFLLQK